MGKLTSKGIRWYEFPLPSDQIRQGYDDLGIPYLFVAVKLSREQARSVKKGLERFLEDD